jgi:P4 family phage/plasmid primase-like protien
MTAGRITEAELEDLKARNPCDVVAGAWVSLRQHGKKMIGPCPLHSADPHARDSTSFECDAAGWVCATCADGGDVIKLVALRENLDPQKDFRKVIEILGGKREIDPAEAARAEKLRADLRAQRDRDSRAYRERERQRLWGMFHPAAAIAGTPAESYLALRQVVAPATSPPRLRYLPNCPMYATGAAGAKPVHSGPALLAAIVGDGGRFSALHITWLDLNEAKGKAAIADPLTGDLLPAKKVRGSKAGGRIELVPRAAPRRLVIGEGIETVLSVWTALEGAGRDLSDTAFWSAVDLGNIGGRAAATVPHPTLKTANGRTQRVPGPTPDMTANGLAIPDTVDEILLLGDGDSDRFLIECTFARAVARFARNGRTVRVAFAPAGMDFNDVLQLEGGRSTIVDLVDAAEVPPAPVIATPDQENKGARKARDRSSSSSVDKDPDNVVDLDARRAGAAPAPPRATQSKARSKPSHTGGTGKRPPARGVGGDDGDDLNERLAFYPQTDLGNAERFRERCHGKILWCPALGWLAWDGKRWSREAAEEAVKIAEHDTVRAIQKEARAIRGTDKDVKIDVDRNGNPIMLSDKLKKWGRSSEAANKLNAISRRAAPYMHVSPAKLDADRFMVNCNNGTLVIRRNDDGDAITFVKHNPADLITKLIPVDYDPAALCPTYDRFLADVQPRESARVFLHQWFGLSLTGDTSEQKLLFLHGKGKNGKSTLLEIIAYTAGDYGKALPIETFLDQGRGRNAGQATPDLAILPGVRYLRTSEPERGAKLAEALIKLATGGDPIQARHLQRDYFEFMPQFKLTMSGNYKPKIEGTDEGIWRRVVLVPWEITVSNPDKLLLGKLQAEASGILNRLLDGLCDWLDRGLVLPEEVVKATAEFRSDSDPIGRFLDVCTRPAVGARVQASELYRIFIAWAKANGERESTITWFGRALGERGMQSLHSNVNWWLGIEQTKNESDFVDVHGNPLRQADKPAAPSQGGGAASTTGPEDEFIG